MSNPEFTVLGNELASKYIEEVAEATVPEQPFRVPGPELLGTFHNSTSSKVLKHEKPWHRYALHLFARAKMNCKDIAECLQVSVSSVQTLIKQPWFQEQYNALVSQRADSIYEQLLDGEDVNSLLTLVELRDNPNTKSATRAACAFDILDRMKGKAVQRTLSVSHAIKDNTSIDKMKQELVELEQEEQTLLGASAKQPNANGVIK